jgi:flagellar motor component MotA
LTREEFIVEYHIVAARALQLSEKARKQGLLSLEGLKTIHLLIIICMHC